MKSTLSFLPLKLNISLKELYRKSMRNRYNSMTGSLLTSGAHLYIIIYLFIHFCNRSYVLLVQKQTDLSY